MALNKSFEQYTKNWKKKNWLGVRYVLANFFSGELEQYKAFLFSSGKKPP